MLEVRDPSDGFAVAEALGVDAAHAEEQAPELRQALARNGVLCLRMDAPLSEEG
ncbi:MAG: hypothetical protein JRH10_20830, partial [Deltaproteobacteria bacterium]|nr:hypothetical protein [Deltaproteobacteria bacterium]